jgi:alpha-amylase
MSALFTRYAASLRTGDLRGVAILNYLDSHDDGSPYDLDREDPFGAATRLLLAPGGAQIYYGDELARPLSIEGAAGDANLRSFMNWNDLEAGGTTGAVLEHWRKLGRFRRAHPAVGAGAHRTFQEGPLIFGRILAMEGLSDRVLVALDLSAGPKTLPAFDVFVDGTDLVDTYSGATATVADGEIALDTPYTIVLLSERP